MEKLWEFNWDCGRMGWLDSVFIATDDEIKNIIGKTVYFGEVLGKHSDIHGTIEEGEITLITDNQEVVNILKNKLGKTISGHNPIEYYKTNNEE
jgi:hypothetical protein